MSKSKKKRLNRKQNKRKNRAQALRYGGLEPRKLLATVTTPTEAALRDAIETTNQSATDDTINFSFSNQTILIESGQLNIFDDLTINGNNNTIAVDNEEFRVLNVTSTVADRGQSPADHNVTLNSLNIAQGRTDGEHDLELSFNENFYSGGGIRFNSTGTLTLDNSHVYNNGAIDFGSKGGGIFAVGPVVLQSNTLVNNNYTGLDKFFGDSGELGAGGGVFSETSVTVNNSSVTNNSTFGYGAGGAGIASFGNVILDNGSVVSGNYTDGRYSDGGGVFAGGIKEFGGGSLYESANVVVKNGSIVENNRTKVRFSKGGGIAASGNVTIESGSIVRDNRTEGKQSHGGGIYAGRELIIDNSTLSGNHTVGGTTKLAEVVCKLGVELAKEVVGSVLPANKVIDIATSIYDALALANEFTGVVDLDPCPEAFASGGYGGGAAGRKITIQNNSVITNNFTDGYGANGGALFSLGNLSISNSSVSSNETRQTQSAGGAVFAVQEVTLTNSTVENNRTLGRLASGGAIAGNFLSGKVVITNSLLRNNSTAGSGAGGSNSKGGAVFANEVTVTNSEIADNKTTGDRSAGGAIFARENVTATNSVFTGNYTTGDTGSQSANNFFFTNQNGGGAIASREVIVNGSTFDSNGTTGDEAHGGAIYAAIDVSLVNSTIAGNFATGDEARGGGLFASFDGRITQSTITGNASGYEGGGIYARRDLSLTNSIVLGNLALDLDDDTSTAGHELHVGEFWNGTLETFGVNVGQTGGNAEDVFLQNTSGPGIISGNAESIFDSRSTLSGNGESTRRGDLSDNLGIEVGPNSTIIQTVPLEQTAANVAIDAAFNPADLFGLPTEFRQFWSQDARGVPRGIEVNEIGNSNSTEVVDLGAVELLPLTSQFTVTNNLDSGAGSLRDAITLANINPGTDTITFENSSPSSSTFSIQLLSPLPNITEAVNIVGSTESGTYSTVMGTASGSRIFNFTSAYGSFNIDSLSLEGGRTTGNNSIGSNTFSGGAIRSLSDFGTVRLTDSRIVDNSTSGDRAEGGAIFATGRVILDNTFVSGNETIGAFAPGGAISANVVKSYDSVIDFNTTVDSNSSGGALNVGFGAFIYNSEVTDNATLDDDSKGGAIYSAYGDVLLESSLLSGNYTQGNSSSGGAIRASDVTVTSSNVSGNYTTGSTSSGGAISALRTTITDSNVEGNRTQSNNSVGGAVIASLEVDIVNSSLIGNSTAGNDSGGGAIFSLGENNIIGSTFANNRTGGSQSHGGAIASYSYAVNLTSSTVAGNSVGSTTSDGGGIYTYSSSNAPVIVSDSIVAGNFSNAASNPNHEIKAPTSFYGQNIVGEDASDFNASGLSNVSNASAASLFLTTASNVFDSNGDGTANLAADGHYTGVPAFNGGSVKTIALNPTVANPALDGTLAPISLFSFEGDASDGFGSNNGTLEGGLTADAPGRDGVSENAIAIDGDGTKYVQLANPLTIGDKSHTVETWIKVPAIGVDGLGATERVGVILGTFGNTSLNVNWEIHDDGQMRVFWRNGERNIFGEKDLRDGQWHHVAFVRDTVADEFRFYVDGVEEVTTGTNNAGTDFTFTQPSRIGQDNRSSTPVAFHGSIDELTIHGEALTEAQVRARAGLDNRGGDRVVLSPGANGAPQMDIGSLESTADVPNLVVTTLEDVVDPLDGVTSLREAVATANSGDADGDGEAFDEITFSPELAGGTLSLVNGELNVTEGLLINATNAQRIIIDAGNQSRVINFTSAADELELVNLTLIRGETTGNGGAINSTSSGLVQLFGTRVSQSSAGTGGGGIFASGTVELYDSVVDGNETTDSTAQGGGVLATGEIIAINSTLYANETLGASGEGGALAGLGGITLYNSAVVSNTAGGSFGGGLYTGSSTLPINVNNSIVLGNSSSAIAYSEIDDFGPINFGGHNIVGENAATFLTAGFSNVENAPLGSVFVDSRLGGVLSDTILPVIELAPAQTNPALDAGDDSLAASDDALGNLRIINLPTVAEETGGNFIDLGPYELQLTEEELPSLTVDTNLDVIDPFDLHTSLREAINYANAIDAGSFENGDADADGNLLDTITFASGPGEFFEQARTISLTSQLPNFTSDIAVVGTGETMLTIDALGNGRIFEFGSAGAGTFSVEGLTLTNGDAGTGSGGAILLNDADDTLTVNGVRFLNNSANGGGAISVTGSTFEIFNSSFVGNHANFSGSSIHSLGNAIGWIANSTFSANTSGTDAGTVFVQAGGGEAGSVHLRNTTVADNLGAALQVFTFTGGSGLISVGNTIVSNNSGSNAAIGGSGNSSVQSVGKNISDDGSTSFDDTTDLINTDPQLTAIDFTADSLFHGLQPTSAAIDAGNNNEAQDIAGNLLPTDQRGLDRFFDGLGNGSSTVDIGAIEINQVVDAIAPGVESIAINGGETQRSMIREITISFSEIVNVSSSSFMVENLDTAVCYVPDVATQVVDGKTIATLTFSGTGITGGSLPDGNYRLTLLDTITDTAGNQLDGDANGAAGGNATDDFFRLYGDATGDGTVNVFDLLQFRQAFNSQAGDSNFNSGLDATGDGRVNVFDLLRFRQNFGKSV